MIEVEEDIKRLLREELPSLSLRERDELVQKLIELVSPYCEEKTEYWDE